MSTSKFQIEYCEDSFAALANLDDDEFDVTITDPPYNAHVQSNMISGTAMKKFVSTGGGGSIPHKELPFDALSGYGFARELVRGTKRWVLSFCAVEDFAMFKAAVRVDVKGKEDTHWARGQLWYKPNSQGQMTGDRPAAACEGIATMYSAGKKMWNARGAYGYYRCADDDGHYIANGTRGEDERHPNQKPLRLCLELVAKFSNRGETVFDPFCGSGRIGEACILLGRHYVGLDLPLDRMKPTKGRGGVIIPATDWIPRARRRLQRAEQLGFGVVADEACLRLCSGMTERDLPPLPESVLAIAKH